MKNNIIIINRKCEKHTIRNKLDSFFEKYEEDFYPLVRVKTKDKEIIGMVWAMRYALSVKTSQDTIHSIRFKDITSVKILDNHEVFKIMRSLTRTNTALSAKRLKEATLKLKELIQVAKKNK